MSESGSTPQSIGSSFRDPSGFIFEHQGRIQRQINQCYADQYDLLMSSSLYEALVAKQLLIEHDEIPSSTRPSAEHYKTLLPERVPFVSYPYEWCFSQLKDAALCTLRVQSIALHHGMTLKDASAYNIQFLRGAPIFIDTLSFERYHEGQPWHGYRQFCQHFLAPLALVAYRDVRLTELLKSNIDGVPLDLAAKILPRRTWLRLGLLLHLKLHAGYQRRYQTTAGCGGEAAVKQPSRISKAAQLHLIGSLAKTIRKLKWTPRGTEWAEYESGDSYRESSLVDKQAVVRRLLDKIQPASVWDLGANTGAYSRIAAELGAEVCSFDIDPACVERNYLDIKAKGEQRILPLLLNLVNPSPSIGWAHSERLSLADRAGPDLVLALALIHHIAISNNVPLSRIASFFAQLAEHLLIEFVPKDDPKVMTLLATREDVFPDYTRNGFEASFGDFYEITDSSSIQDSGRILYLMQRRSSVREGRSS